MSNITKSYNILNNHQKKNGQLILILILIGTLVEAAGVGLIIPFLSIVVDPSILNDYPVVINALSEFGSLNNHQVVMISAGSMAIVYLIKVVYLIYKTKKQALYIYKLQANLSNRLFTDYMHRSYIFHLQINSSKLIHNIIGEVQGFINVIVNSLALISEIFIVLALTVLMFIVNTQVALVVVILFTLFGVSMYTYYRNRMHSLGRDRQLQERNRHKHLQQGFGGFKEIKLFGREYNFIDRFKLPTNNLILINSKHQASLEMPRIFLEFLVITIFLIITVMLFMQDSDMSKIMPTMAMFAAIAIRVMPSVSRILYSTQELKFFGPSISVMSNEFSTIERQQEEKKEMQIFVFNKSIVFDSVSYSYPKSDVKILHNISTNIMKNSLVGVVGESGAGKSTLIDLILGLIKPNKGSIKVDDLDMHSNIRGWQNNIGYIPQTVYLTDDSIKSNIAFGVNADEIDSVKLNCAIKSAQLEEFIFNLPDGVETLVGECGSRISGGQRQRIGIARALYNDPDVLVMDEATSALDKETEMQIMNLIKGISQLKTLIFVTHRESVIGYCDKVLILESGSLTESGPVMNQSR